MGTAREMSYLGRDGHWRVGSSDRRAENPGRPQAGQEGPAGGTTPGGWWSAAGPGRRGSRAGGAAGSGEASLGRGRGRSGAARGLRAAGGGLARGGGSRSPAPRLSEDAATSGGGPRRPGMAAWSPAAAAPLLRGIRGVSAGGTGLLFPGGSCGGTAGPAAARGRAPGERGAGPGGLPFLSLIHSSLVGFFSGPGRRASEKRRAPARAGGAPEPVEVGDEGDRHRNSHDPAGAEKAVLMYCAGDMAVTARRPGAGECEGSGLWALGFGQVLPPLRP